MPYSINYPKFSAVALVLFAVFLSSSHAETKNERFKKKTRVTSDKMESQNNPRIFIFTGHAVAKQKGVTVKGDEIKAIYGKKGAGIKTLSATGNVRVINKKSITTGRQADLFPNGNRVEVKGNAVSTQKEGVLKSDDIKILYGENNEEIIEIKARGDAELTSGERIITADNLTHYPPKRKSHAFGNATAKSKKVEVRADRIDVWHADIEGEDPREIVGDGNVEIIGKEKLIIGDHAVQYPSEKKVVITGNAYYMSAKDKVKGKKIIYFYERDDIIMVGDSKKRAKIRLTPKKKDKE